MRKLIRKVIRYLPKGKTLAINSTLALFGRDYNGIIKVDDRKFYIRKLNDLNRSLFFLGEYEPKITEFVNKVISNNFI
mgnify:CR=1 FL=1